MPEKIYACYSPSHQPLLVEHFLPTIPCGFDVVLRRHDQVCPSGNYRSENWRKAVSSKCVFIIDAIELETRPFIYSDIDVRFYDLRPEELIRHMPGDIACQQDAGAYCTGFMFIKPCAATKKLFRHTLDALSTDRYHGDQDAFNQFALPPLLKSGELAISFLPDRYWNIGPNWHGEGPPGNLAIHHANWVVGIPEKMSLLNLIRSRHEGSSSSAPGPQP